VQRRPTSVVLGIDNGFVGQQQFRHVFMVPCRRPVQRRPVVGVFAENQLRLLFEQRLNLRQISEFGRIMNFAAKGVAARNQYNQRDDGKA
jgi:hypothetical protein